MTQARTATIHGFGNAGTLTLADVPRLQTQLEAVRNIMVGGAGGASGEGGQCGQWWTLNELAAAVESAMGRRVSEASISARLRDLRKPQFGGYIVLRRAVGGSGHGLFEYRVLPRP
jgi:hypothetical protein